MKDLRNQLLVDNLNEKKNTGLIPMVNALTQYVIQPVSVNSYFAIGRYNVEGHILTYQLHIMLMRDVVDYNVSLTDETTGEFWADDKIIPQAMAEIRVEGGGQGHGEIRHGTARRH